MYIELVRQFINRGYYAPVSTLQEETENAQKDNSELYHSLFLFKTIPQTVAQADSEVYLNEIILDIDRKKANNGDELVLLETQEVYKEIKKQFGITPSVYFSGNGYHLYIPDIFDFGILEETSVVNYTIKKYFPTADNIYDKTRIIRAPNTINKKSGLYKTLLTEEELFSSPSEIKAKAKEPTNEWHTPITEYQTFPEKKAYMRKTITHSPTITTNPNVTCMQHLYNEGATEGSRHTSMLRLTSAFRRAGIPLSGIKAMLYNWSPNQEKEEVDKIVDYTFNKGYSYSCKDPVMSKYCDSKCYYYKNKNYEEEIYTAEESLKDYIKFLEKDIVSYAMNFNYIYKLPHNFHILPGEFVLVIAETKIGKSAWVQNLIVKFNTLKTLYLSLEMSPRLTFRRFLQIAHGYSKNQIAENAETLSIDPLQHIEISSNLNDLEGITRYIKEKDFKVLVVDVIDGLKTTSRVDDKMEALAPELKRIANDLDIIVIGIHHISKYASRESKLDIHSGKGSSGAEQKADKIFGIEGNREGTLRKIKVLGARDESTFEIFAESDPVNFRFYQLIGETK